VREIVAAYITQLTERNRPEIRARKDLVDEAYRHVIAQGQTDISVSELVRVVDQLVREAIRRGRAARIGRGQYVFGSILNVLEFESDYIGGPLGYAPPNSVGRSVRSSESILIEQLSAQNLQLFAQVDRLQDLLKMKGSVLGLITDDEFLCVSAPTRKILFEAQDYAL
jgi:hypothetical protein